MAAATSSAGAEGWAKMKFLPPVSPTTLGYDLYFFRFSPIWHQSVLKVFVEPVKWKPAKSGLDRMTRPTVLPWPGMKFTTPSGRPASLKTFMSR